MKKISLFVALAFTGLSAIHVGAQSKTTKAPTSDKDLSAGELARKLANPVAKLISVPIENDVDFGIGEFRGARNTTNIQPVIPFQISEKWNLITRVVLPIVMQYDITGPGTRQRGLSDTQVSAFLSPISDNKDGFLWGGGPIISMPTGTNDYLTTKKWGVGPSLVGLFQKDGWTYGAMVNQVWSVAGDRHRDDINQMFVEPFASYQWDSGAGVMVVGEYTQDWEHHRSSMILQASLTGITAIGKQKIQILFGPRFTVFGPSAMRSDFGITGGITLPFIK
ncbi:transporter [Myroides sp. LJL119]